MHSLITSYLLQHKECFLPAIGTLKVITTPASTDHDNNKILPPFQTILFINGSGSGSTGLVQYISRKENIPENEAEAQLNNFCNDWKEKIQAGERLHFETVGFIYKNADGKISFERENSFSFLQAIAVDKGYKKEPTLIHEENVTVNENSFSEEPIEQHVIPATENVVVEKSYWGFWALILLAIGSVLLFYHFKDHRVSTSSVGNQYHPSVDTATATYRTK